MRGEGGEGEGEGRGWGEGQGRGGGNLAAQACLEENKELQSAAAERRSFPPAAWIRTSRGGAAGTLRQEPRTGSSETSGASSRGFGRQKELWKELTEPLSVLNGDENDPVQEKVKQSRKSPGWSPPRSRPPPEPSPLAGAVPPPGWKWAGLIHFRKMCVFTSELSFISHQVIGVTVCVCVGQTAPPAAQPWPWPLWWF